ncbi:MAG: SUMF1/EgtB/PvdO family nonheme iron enzyme [Candidatus Nitrotoga sp.]
MAGRSSLRFLVSIWIFALYVPTASIAAGSPDLVPDEVRVSTPSTTLGQTIRVSWTMANKGDGDAKASVTGLRLRPVGGGYDITLIREVATLQIDAGRSINVQYNVAVPADAPAGRYFVLVIADNSNPSALGTTDSSNDYAQSGEVTMNCQSVISTGRPLVAVMEPVPESGFVDPGYARTEAREHVGTDYRAAGGSCVFAVREGEVESNSTSNADPMQAVLTIKHGDGSRAYYGHIESSLGAGSKVGRGALLGTVRQPTTKFASHLHYGEWEQPSDDKSIKDPTSDCEKASWATKPSDWGWGRVPLGTTREHILKCGWIDTATKHAWLGSPTTNGLSSADLSPNQWVREPEGNDKPRSSVIGNVFKDCPDCPDMINIPAGSFEMGSIEGKPEEKPVHKVTMNAFALGKTEITQGQWRAVMGSNPSNFNGCGDDCPVGMVSWNDAQVFIQKLNSKTGKQYRLPSESEWEYACRAGGQNEYCGSDNVDSVAWHKDYGGAMPHPVGLKNPNAFAVYDMSGNVQEWVEDGSHHSYIGAPTNGSAWQGDNDFHVTRGGAWSFIPGAARAASRMFYNEAILSSLPSYYRATIGFRVARVSAGTDSAIQGRVDDLKNIVVPPLLSQERFPETATPRANSDLSAEENQLDNCQRLEKQNIIEQAIAACLPLVWSKNSKIRKQSSGSFADAVSTKNRRLVTNQPKSLPILPDPYIVHGGCPGEGCMFGMLSAQGTIQIFEQPGSKKIIGQLVRGERVAALLGELRVHPLKGVVVGKIDQLRLGESVYLLDYEGEGQSHMWIRGRVVGDPRWDFSCRPTPACKTAIRFSGEKNGLKKGEVVHADSVWWVKIQRRNGQTGWVGVGANFILEAGMYYYPEFNNVPDPFDEMPMATAS